MKRVLSIFVLLSLLLVLVPMPAHAGVQSLTAADSGGSFTLATANILSINLASMPGAGLVWRVTTLPNCLEAYSPDHFEATGAGVGGTNLQKITLVGASSGSGRLVITLYSPSGGILDTWGATLTSAGVFTGAAYDPEFEDELYPWGYCRHGQPNWETPELPAHFNWAEMGASPPIRDQKAAGTCWAFATVGATEMVMKIKDGAFTDLSEQYLVSCCTEDWGNNHAKLAGWHAHEYHDWKYDPTEETTPGPVLEADFPYTCGDPPGYVIVPCNGPHNHSAVIDYAIPDTTDCTSAWYMAQAQTLKRLIYTYGPVSVGVCVGNDFKAYTGGIFNNVNFGCHCTWNFVDSINHMVTLTGWDEGDNPPYTGYWYLRNSWGTQWGESGVMRIAWGTSNVGWSTRNHVYHGGLDTLWQGVTRGNLRYTRSIKQIGQVPQWSNAAPYINDSAGANTVALSDYYVGDVLYRSRWIGNNKYEATYPIVDGVIGEGSWTGPVSINAFLGQGSGNVHAEARAVIGTTLWVQLWRGGYRYRLRVPIVSGEPDWDNAEDWGGPYTTSGLPGSGTVQALMWAVTGSTLRISLWRNNYRYNRLIPIVSGAPDWGNAGNWTGPYGIGDMPGSGTLQAVSNVSITPE